MQVTIKMNFSLSEMYSSSPQSVTVILNHFYQPVNLIEGF